VQFEYLKYLQVGMVS